MRSGIKQTHAVAAKTGHHHRAAVGRDIESVRIPVSRQQRDAFHGGCSKHGQRVIEKICNVDPLTIRRNFDGVRSATANRPTVLLTVRA